MTTDRLAAALAAAFTPAELDLIAPYLTKRAVEAQATRRLDAAAALARLADAVAAAVGPTTEDPAAAAFNAGVKAAADAIERHAESVGWYEGGGVWADAIEEARKAARP